MLSGFRTFCKSNYSRLLRRSFADKPKDQAIKFNLTEKNLDNALNQDPQRNANRFYNWFSTLKGQKIVGSCWIAISIGGALYHVAPHWFFLDQVKSIYQSYTNGFRSKVQQDMLLLINEVTKDMKLTDQEVSSLGIFVSIISEPYGWGELGRNGMVGFPDQFHYKSESEVPLEKMRIGLSSTGSEQNQLTESQVASETGKSFAASLVMSDDAKKFALAREIERTKMQPFIFHGTLSTCFILLNYNFARIINKRLELFSRPPMFRMYLYLGLPPTMILSYFLLKDGYNRYIDKELDRRTAGLSPEYAKAGVEYYDKLLTRNVALRELQGEAGKSVYTGKGDVIQGIIRQKTATLTERRTVCAQNNFVKAS